MPLPTTLAGEIEVLREAATLIRNHWCAGYRECDGKYCALGALSFAMGDNPIQAIEELDHSAFLSKLSLEVPQGKYKYPEWIVADWSNTADGPTVADKFLAVADKWENNHTT